MAVRARADVDSIKHDDFTLFSEYDFNKKGEIGSTYPIWYFSSVVERLEEEIIRLENALRNNYIPDAHIPEYKEHLAAKKNQLRQITDAKDKLNSGELRDMAQKVVVTLSEKISNTLFTKRQMAEGDPTIAAEEARLMTEKIIPINDEEKKWAKVCNVKVVNGKVTRVDLEKMWKLARSILGEPTNVELLRKQ